MHNVVFTWNSCNTTHFIRLVSFCLRFIKVKIVRSSHQSKPLSFILTPRGPTPLPSTLSSLPSPLNTLPLPQRQNAPTFLKTTATNELWHLREFWHLKYNKHKRILNFFFSSYQRSFQVTNPYHLSLYSILSSPKIPSLWEDILQHYHLYTARKLFWVNHLDTLILFKSNKRDKYHP